MPTKIAWTDESWNPVTGCTPVSEGCQQCYAEKLSKRFGWSWNVTLHPDRLDIPLHWRKPRMVFVPSMGDLFHEDVGDTFIDAVFATMAICGAERQTCKWAGCDHDERSGCWQDGEGRPNPRHTFQVLTKRPGRMRDYLAQPDRRARIEEAAGACPDWSIGWQEAEEIVNGQGWPLPNIWLGVSVENQARADERIPLLLETPAAVRFVSAEPLLGPLDELYPWLGTTWEPSIDWVIAGGESGGPPERRLVERCECRFGPMAPHLRPRCSLCNETTWRPKPEALEWVRSIRDQCAAAGVPFFLKQLGPRAGQGTLLDGREHKEVPVRAEHRTPQSGEVRA